MSSSTNTARRSPNLDRDQKLKILTLHNDGRCRRYISERLGVTPHQVRYTIEKGVPSPKKSTGRPRKLTPTQVDYIEEFVCSSRENRRMSYLEVASYFSHWDIGEIAVKNALESRGYSRCLARDKPPISETNRIIRKSWAEAHLNWTIKDWSLVLWSDETWINDGQKMPKYVTRKAGQEYDNTCVNDKYRKSNSWMFWGCFSGVEKGPCVFWEKAWGKINSQSYCEFVLPHVSNWMVTQNHLTGRRLMFMHDNAPSHNAIGSVNFLRAYGIEPIHWPAFSPDLNPIEAVWSHMKNFIQVKYPEFERGSLRPSEDVRQIIQEAWDAITPQQLLTLIESMPRRCQAVIDADGGPTPY